METGLCCEGFTSDWNQACFDAPLVFVFSGKREASKERQTRATGEGADARVSRSTPASCFVRPKKRAKKRLSAGDVYHEKKIIENWFVWGCFF